MTLVTDENRSLVSERGLGSYRLSPILSCMTEDSLLLTNEDRALLMRVGGLLEGIVETLEVLEDRKTMESLRQAEEDVKAGRVRDYGSFIGELRRSGEV